MCGLAFAFSKRGRGVGKQVYEMYKAQESRGKEGFGYVAIHNGNIVAVERAQKEEGIKHKLLAEKSELILFHHRMPTSTKNTLGTTHPIFVSNPELEFDYYVAHNGVITNDDVMKTRHEGLGYIYTTEFTEHVIAKYKNGVTEELDADRAVYNDSECLAIELARYIEGLSNRVDTSGSAAFWVVQLEKSGTRVETIFFGKNKGRDLKITRSKKWWGVSSETGQDIESMKLFSVTPGDPQLYEQELNIDESLKASKIGYQTTRYAYEDNNKYERYDVYYGSQTKNQSVKAYEDLVNAYYSMAEASDTGVPLGEFTRTLFEGTYYYVPTKFLGQQLHERRLYSDWPFPSVLQLPTPKEADKDKNSLLLDQLCSEHAEKQCLQEKYQDMYDRKIFTEVAFKKLNDQLELELLEIQDKISTLGYDIDDVEEVMEMAKELADYNHSFDGYKETEHVQFS